MYFKSAIQVQNFVDQQRKFEIKYLLQQIQQSRLKNFASPELLMILIYNQLN